jgi:membrane associated rhomboid family serine protease
MFGHLDLLHLAGNMVFLFCFGNAVNAKLGHVSFVIFYLAAGVVGAAMWMVFGYGSGTLGASGAIWGVIGAFFVLYPRNDVSVLWWWPFPPRAGTFEVSSWIVILSYFAFDVWNLSRAAVVEVNYLDHLAGAVFGFVATAVLLKTGYIESTRDEENLFEVFHRK